MSGADEQDHIARAAAALDDPGVTREAAPRAVDPLREALIHTTARLVAAVSLLERSGKAAKKAAPSDRMFDQMLKDYKAAVGIARAALAAAPQPAPVDRDALVDLISGELRSEMGHPQAFWFAEDIADALLARGLRLSGTAQPDETLAWGAVDEAGRIDMGSIAIDPDDVRLTPQPGLSVVRVAIRRVEDEA